MKKKQPWKKKHPRKWKTNELEIRISELRKMCRACAKFSTEIPPTECIGCCNTADELLEKTRRLIPP